MIKVLTNVIIKATIFLENCLNSNLYILDIVLIFFGFVFVKYVFVFFNIKIKNLYILIYRII